MLNYTTGHYRPVDHDPWSLLCKRLDNEVCEQVQERNKKDIETETVAYINNVTVHVSCLCALCFSWMFWKRL